MSRRCRAWRPVTTIAPLGFTIFGIDQQDLYVERLHPNDNELDWYRGGWERMQVERTTIAIHQDTPRAVDLRFMRHGPVIYTDKARRRAFALRWVGLEPGTAGYPASLSPQHGAQLDGIPQRGRTLEGAAENPRIRRRRWEHRLGRRRACAGAARVGGLLPCRAPTASSRDVFCRPGTCPSFSIRRAGITTANHNILPDGYTHSLGYEFSSPHRFGRIELETPGN